MKVYRKNSKIYYRYSALYLGALMLISLAVLSTVLSISAKMLKTTGEHNTRSSLQQVSDYLDNQLEVMENIALQIGTKTEYRPIQVEKGGFSDITLLEKFKQYSNHSPLLQNYFLTYRSVQKIYTSSGTTSYFNYYAPDVLQVSQELTDGMLKRITNTGKISAEQVSGGVLLIYPVRFPGLSGTYSRPAHFCVLLSEAQIATCLADYVSDCPDTYHMTFYGLTVCGKDGQVSDADTISVSSAGGRVTMTVPYTVSGWTQIMNESLPSLGLTAAICLILAVIIAFAMAHFSLNPIEKLLSKHSEATDSIQNEFNELDRILSTLEQNNESAMHNLRGYLLSVILRGEYSRQLVNRWEMLGISFDGDTCRVYIIENGASGGTVHEISDKLEGISHEDVHVYAVVPEGSPHIVLIVNYASASDDGQILSAVEDIARGYGLRVFRGTPVDGPGRIPLSYMAALSELGLTGGDTDKRLLSAKQLASALINAVTGHDDAAVSDIQSTIREYISGESIGAMTRYNIYSLTSSITSEAERRNINIDKPSVNALVLLTDPTMIAEDLTHILAAAQKQAENEGDETGEAAQAIVRYVIANAFDPDIDLQSMSEVFGLSPDYISSMIKRETGTAFKEYVTQLRISEAQRLLAEDSSLTVSEVALRVGYRKASNFSKKFRELTGTLPSQGR